MSLIWSVIWIGLRWTWRPTSPKMNWSINWLKATIALKSIPTGVSIVKCLTVSLHRPRLPCSRYETALCLLISSRFSMPCEHFCIWKLFTIYLTPIPPWSTRRVAHTHIPPSVWRFILLMVRLSVRKHPSASKWSTFLSTSPSAVAMGAILIRQWQSPLGWMPDPCNVCTKSGKNWRRQRSISSRWS